MSYHVRDVLESVRDTAPAPRTTTDDIIARGRRTRARRTASVLAAVAVVAVAGVSALVVKLPGDDAPIAAAGAGPSSSLIPADVFNTVLGEYRTGKYQIGPVRQVTVGYQELPVYRDGETWPDDSGKTYPLTAGIITVYRPGVFNPKDFGRGFSVTVAGKPGLAQETVVAVGPSGAPDASAPPPQPTGTSLAWQYDPGAWATFVPDAREHLVTTEEAVRIAAVVTPKTERPVLVPYTPGSLPAGWQTVAVTQTPRKLSNLVSEVYLHKGPIAEAQPVDIRLPGVHVVVMKGDPKDEDVRGRNGVHCYSTAQRVVPACIAVYGKWFIDVDGRDSGLSGAQIETFTRSLKPADFEDQATWVPVEK